MRPSRTTLLVLAVLPAVAACAAPGTHAPAPVAAPTALDSAAAAAGGGPGAGADAAPRPAAEPWEVQFDPYLWLFDIDGSVSARGRSIPVSTHLQDAVDLVQDHLQFGFAGHLEARQGDWSVFLDGNMLSFEADADVSSEVVRGFSVGPVSVSRSVLRTAEIDTKLDLAIAEVGAAWHAGDLHPAEGCTVPVEILGGARWNSADLDVDLDVDVQSAREAFERAFSPDFETDWVDPFVGFRTRIPLADGVALRLRGDIGGGFGSGSDRAWNAIAMLEFRVSECVSAFAGWRWYDWERDISGRSSNLQMEGPGAGVTIRF